MRLDEAGALLRKLAGAEAEVGVEPQVPDGGSGRVGPPKEIELDGGNCSLVLWVVESDGPAAIRKAASVDHGRGGRLLWRREEQPARWRHVLVDGDHLRGKVQVRRWGAEEPRGSQGSLEACGRKAASGEVSEAREGCCHDAAGDA